MAPSPRFRALIKFGISVADPVEVFGDFGVGIRWLMQVDVQLLVQPVHLLIAV